MQSAAQLTVTLLIMAALAQVVQANQRHTDRNGRRVEKGS